MQGYIQRTIRTTSKAHHGCTHAVDPIAGNEVIPLNTSYRNWKVTCNG